MVIADNCTPNVNVIDGDTDGATGSEMVLATIRFDFKVHGDFSG